jgi:hypothetical protein
VAVDSPATVVMVADDGREVVVGRVCAQRAGLELVDALLQLQLRAQRHGWALRLRDVTDDLCRLLELAGLADVLALEAGREAELLEQGGGEEVEEVVEPGDASA